MNTIITGELHSGKTTKAAEIVSGIPGCGGFLSKPVFTGGKLCGYDLHFIESEVSAPFIRTMETADPEEPVRYALDKYRFYERTFAKAETLLAQYCGRNMPAVLVDEMGILECRKQGFYEPVKKLISGGAELITCVRRTCLDAIVSMLPLEDVRIIEV